MSQISAQYCDGLEVRIKELQAENAALKAELEQWQRSVCDQGEVIENLKAELAAVTQQERTMLHDTIAKQIPQLARGQVWCRQCGKTRRVDSAEAMRNGWPKCCGCTMTIDSPEEHRIQRAAVAGPLQCGVRRR